MKKYEQWNIRLLGPLGRALDHFCSCHLAQVDFDALLLPFKEKSGPRCGTDSLLWGEVVNTGIIANHFVKNSDLGAKLRKAVSDMVALQDSGAALSAYPEHLELQEWDIVGRSNILNALVNAYVYMGEAPEVKAACVKIAVDIMSKVGPGKRSILHCGKFGGLDSSALLDAVSNLCHICNECHLIDFARYIANLGCSQQHNIFDGIHNVLSPCELGNGNAVWLNNCFEGLAELSLADAAGSPAWRSRCRRYFEKLVAEELFITGTGGGVNAEGSLWCKGALAQTDATCRGGNFGNSAVTVSLLRLFEVFQRALHSHLPAAWAERALYNALLGVWNPENCTWGYLNPGPLSGFSVKTYSVPEEKISWHNYIAAGGLAMAPLIAARSLEEETGVEINLYEDMNIELPNWAAIHIRGNFPAADHVHLRIKSRKEFTLALRIPEYCTGVYYQDCRLDFQKDSYLKIRRTWSFDETLTLQFDPKARRVAAPGKAPFEALMRGPLVLTEGTGEEAPDVMTRITRNRCLLTDYASAGRPRNGGAPFRVWFPKEEPDFLDYD